MSSTVEKISDEQLAKSLGNSLNFVKGAKKPFRRNTNRSIMAKQVAKDVIDKVRTGKRINLQEIQKAHGYSVSSASAMKATQTLSYQEEIRPVIESMESLRKKVLVALHRKDLDTTKVFDLNLLLKNLNHDTQLLNGKSTANNSHINKVVVYGSDDFLAQQLEDK